MLLFIVDSSKFGEKLMSKMGWSKGKGLGAREDGKVDNICVSIKNDTRGLGCSKVDADKWIAHQDDFNDLLASLNQSDTTVDGTSHSNVLSLEDRSKMSKGRLQCV